MFVVGFFEFLDLLEKGCDELFDLFLGEVEFVDVWSKDFGDDSDLEGGIDGLGFLSLLFFFLFVSSSFFSKFFLL